MWTIKKIFDGEYGCEELQPGEKPKVSVTLVDPDGREKHVTAEDEWLKENNLDVGNRWPIIHLRYGVIVVNKNTERYIIAMADNADYPIIISREWIDFPCAEGEYYSFYDEAGMQDVKMILDLLEEGETAKARTKLKKSLDHISPYIDAVDAAVLDDIIPDEWYDAWKEMEGLVTIQRHIPGYWEVDIHENEL